MVEYTMMKKKKRREKRSARPQSGRVGEQRAAPRTGGGGRGKIGRGGVGGHLFSFVWGEALSYRFSFARHLKGRKPQLDTRKSSLRVYIIVMISNGGIIRW